MNLFQISGSLAVILFSFSDLTGSQLNFNRREKVRKGSHSLGSVREEDASHFSGTSGPRSGPCARTGRFQTLQAGGAGQVLLPLAQAALHFFPLEPRRFWNPPNEKQIFLRVVCSRSHIRAR